jgi:hypothetical protein
MDTAEMCRIFITGTSDDVRFRPETFLRPAFFEYMRRAASLPRLAAGWWRDLLFGRGDSRWSDALTRFGGLVPTGLFDSTEIEHFLRDVFTRRGRSNDFRTLAAPLYVVAVELDSGAAVRFGADGWDDVPISRAVQASAALPGLYAPVEAPAAGGGGAATAALPVISTESATIRLYPCRRMYIRPLGLSAQRTKLDGF